MLTDAGVVRHPIPVLVRWLEAGDRGDVDEFDNLLHADAVVHAPRGLSTDSRDAEKAVWMVAVKPCPTFDTRFQEVLIDGNTEMARVIVTGTLTADFGGIPGSGERFRMEQAVRRSWRRQPSEPGPVTVGGNLLRMSRFPAYRSAFGETPSDTLNLLF